MPACSTARSNAPSAAPRISNAAAIRPRKRLAGRRLLRASLRDLGLGVARDRSDLVHAEPPGDLDRLERDLAGSRRCRRPARADRPGCSPRSVAEQEQHRLRGAPSGAGSPLRASPVRCRRRRRRGGPSGSRARPIRRARVPARETRRRPRRAPRDRRARRAGPTRRARRTRRARDRGGQPRARSREGPLRPRTSSSAAAVAAWRWSRAASAASRRRPSRSGRRDSPGAATRSSASWKPTARSGSSARTRRAPICSASQSSSFVNAARGPSGSPTAWLCEADASSRRSRRRDRAAHLRRHRRSPRAFDRNGPGAAGRGSRGETTRTFRARGSGCAWRPPSRRRPRPRRDRRERRHRRSTTSASSSVPFACSIGAHLDARRRADRRRTRSGRGGATRSCRSGRAPDTTLRSAPSSSRSCARVRTYPPSAARGAGSQARQIGARLGLREALGPQLAPAQEPAQGRTHERARSHADKRRQQDLEVLEQGHSANAVACEASHSAARCRMVPPSPPSSSGHP